MIHNNHNILSSIRYYHLSVITPPETSRYLAANAHGVVFHPPYFNLSWMVESNVESLFAQQINQTSPSSNDHGFALLTPFWIGTGTAGTHVTRAMEAVSAPLSSILSTIRPPQLCWIIPIRGERWKMTNESSWKTNHDLDIDDMTNKNRDKNQELTTVVWHRTSCGNRSGSKLRDLTGLWKPLHVVPRFHRRRRVIPRLALVIPLTDAQ